MIRLRVRVWFIVSVRVRFRVGIWDTFRLQSPFVHGHIQINTRASLSNLLCTCACYANAVPKGTRTPEF